MKKNTDNSNMIAAIVHFNVSLFLFTSGNLDFIQRLKLERKLEVHNGCVSKLNIYSMERLFFFLNIYTSSPTII